MVVGPIGMHPLPVLLPVEVHSGTSQERVVTLILMKEEAHVLVTHSTNKHVTRTVVFVSD